MVELEDFERFKELAGTGGVIPPPIIMSGYKKFAEMPWYHLRVDLKSDILDNLMLQRELYSIMQKFLCEKIIDLYFVVIEISSKKKIHIHSMMAPPKGVKSDGNNIRNWWKAKKTVVLSKQEHEIINGKKIKFQPVAWARVKSFDAWVSYMHKDNPILLIRNINIERKFIPKWCANCELQNFRFTDVTDYLREKLNIYIKKDLENNPFSNIGTDPTAHIILYTTTTTPYGHLRDNYTDIGRYMHAQCIEYFKNKNMPPLTPKSFWKYMLNGNFVSVSHFQESKFGRIF